MSYPFDNCVFKTEEVKKKADSGLSDVVCGAFSEYKK
jgi:hypothetical protein